MILTYYILNGVLLASAFLGFRLKGNEKRFSVWLLRALMMIPLLAAEYFCMVHFPDPALVGILGFSECLFALIWMGAAFWMHQAAESIREAKGLVIGIEILVGFGLLILTVFYSIWPNAALGADGAIHFQRGYLFLGSHLFLLVSMVFMAWRLETFWRILTPAQRWGYKFLVAGSYLVCGALGWAVSYRLTYHTMAKDHVHLLGWLLLISWTMMMYAVARHRLLNRKLFISRKVVYAFVAPMAFGLYLILIGVVVLIMRMSDLPFPVVLRWLLWIGGGVALGVMALSGSVRHRVKYFISTHFYTNKYEYRDEWLAFSRLLQGALTEMEVVDALQQVMTKSMYTNIMAIWLGDDVLGFRLGFHKGLGIGSVEVYELAGDAPVVAYLKTHPRYYEDDPALRQDDAGRHAFFPDLNIVLLEPLAIGDQMVGILGIGPEFTGGRYGQDDFDLLAALGTQAASSILAARMAEQLAKNRQQEAWDVMAAFILHDVKNAASMLSLIRQNAPGHLDDPAFQGDLLEAIDDAIKRMDKVQGRLSSLRQDIMPLFQEVDLTQQLNECLYRLEKRLPGLVVNFYRPETRVTIKTDTDLLTRVLENLLLNALEAGGTGTTVTISIRRREAAVEILFEDDGPGIPESLLPSAVFEPFKTTKPKGSGIGLWQARRVAAILGGNLFAENRSMGGARFVLRLSGSDTVEKLDA